MINWCHGVLKVRGKRDCLARFIQESLKDVFILEDKSGIYFYHPSCEVKGMTNAFAASAEKKKTSFEVKHGGTHYIYFHFRQENDVNEVELLRLAKQYNIDFKIYAFCRRDKFQRDIEVRAKEGIVLNESLFFLNPVWECIDPSRGE